MATVQRPRRQPLVQKILIPSGLVKANETVVIEVPSNLKRHAVVVATRPPKTGRDYTSDGMGDEAVPRYPCTFAGETAAAYRQKDKEAEPPQDGDYAEDDSLIYDVDEAEKAEREILFRNLRAFHKARRNVLQGTRNMLSKTMGGMPPELPDESAMVEEDNIDGYDTAADNLDNEAGYDNYGCRTDCAQRPVPTIKMVDQELEQQQLRQQQQQQQQQHLQLQQQLQQQQQQRQIQYGQVPPFVHMNYDGYMRKFRQ